MLASRGASAYMELMEDMVTHATAAKIPSSTEGATLDYQGAQTRYRKLCLYFETRKMKDLYLWAGSVNGGPSAKFLVQQVRPMRDLRLTGNCLLGSRPILSFDGSFDAAPHLAVVKSLLTQIFQPPKGHPRSKPFHDHVISFSALEGRILVRHYQVVPADKAVRGDEGRLSRLDHASRWCRFACLTAASRAIRSS